MNLEILIFGLIIVFCEQGIDILLLENRYTLRNRGHEVLEAADGDEGWRMATEEPIDALVLDAMLPGKTGFDICAGLKGDDRFKHIPVIMLTAMTQDSGEDDQFWKDKSKADDFMSKPFKAQELVKRVEKLLGIE